MNTADTIIYAGAFLITLGVSILGALLLTLIYQRHTRPGPKLFQPDDEPIERLPCLDNQPHNWETLGIAKVAELSEFGVGIKEAVCKVCVGCGDYDTDTDRDNVARRKRAEALGSTHGFKPLTREPKRELYGEDFDA